VGTADEAKKIDFAVNKDILLLLPQNEAETAEAIKRNYVLTVDSFITLDTVCRVANNLNKRARVHIKIDSGMSRLGFFKQDIGKLTTFLNSYKQIAVEGVFSHFYGENNAQCDNQLNRFLPIAEALENALNKPLVKHVANSGGALLSPKYHLDMARIGIGLYGYGNENLKPVKTVTARVVAVKTVKAGEVVGYGGRFAAENDTKIAVINTGYAKGFSRSLAGAKISINGYKCKVVAVCMAMIMADVSDIPVSVGDSAILLGQGVNIENDSVSVYELLCNLK